MDKIFEAAERRRDELRQELRKIEDFLATYRTLATVVRLDSLNTTGTDENSPATDLFVDKVTQETAREAEAAPAAPARRPRTVGNPKPDVVVKAAVEVIREGGAPLSRRDIWEALKARDIEVRGADPVKALGTMLWRSGSEVLEQIEGRGYWLKGEPTPPPTLRELAGNRPIRAAR